MIRFALLSSIVVAGIGLASCVTALPGPGECNAANASFAIGATATSATVEAARVAASAATARTIAPGQAVTMEYLATRLNVDVDSENVILDVRCG